MVRYAWWFFLILVMISCKKEDQIIVELTAQNVQDGKGPRWSPYGQKLKLTANENGFETILKIGKNPANHWPVRMTKTDENPYFNSLFIDQNQNGLFEAEERVDTNPSETRKKIWSSFKTAVYITITDPWTGKEAKNIYPISLWYVFDPNEQPEEELLRFSRNGWLEGNVVINGVEASMILTEGSMDAIIDTADNWSLAPQSVPKELYDYRNNRSVKQHAWLNDNAYRLVEVDPSGMKAILAPFDPGISRVEEAEKLDIYASDKKAKHSGKTVSFEHDFQVALKQAVTENKNLFIDFETTWCGPCKIMDKLVYTADDIVAAAAQTISVKVDGDEHPELVKRFEVQGYPTLILLSPEEEIIDRKVGYQSVASMEKFLNREARVDNRKVENGQKN